MLGHLVYSYSKFQAQNHCRLELCYRNQYRHTLHFRFAFREKVEYKVATKASVTKMKAGGKHLRYNNRTRCGKHAPVWRSLTLALVLKAGAQP